MIKVVSTNNAPQAIGPYSQAVEAKPFLFTSGQIPLTKEGVLVEGDIKVQTEQVFKNIIAILEERQLTLQDVVKATVFLKDMNDFQEMNQVYEAFFKNHKPARSAIEIARLPKDVKIEIEMIVYNP